ncbi:MAG: glycosyltransferase family 4 protein [Chitinivibrionales bacterium]|nr:glycosyltransferase family 4 protein [Chitinivibrionales bacterium]
MRIVVINNLYPPQELGGYGRLLYDFATLLGQRSHTIHVLSSDTAYLGATPSDEPGVERRLVLFGQWKQGVTSVFDMATICQCIEKNCQILVETIDAFRPDVCLLGNIDFIGPQIIAVLLQHHIPILHHLGNQMPGYAIASTPQSPQYCLACASQWLRSQILAKGYPLDNTDVVYPGAKVDYFYTDDQPPFDKLRIAFAGIVLPYKGIHILIKALLILQQKNVDFTCTVAGTTTDDNFLNGIKQVCVKAGLNQKITFTGYLDRKQLRAMYRSHNVMVFPSLVNEAFGITQVEAMASGLLVLSSATGGAAEVVRQGVSGVVFSAGDCFSLAESLMQVSQNRDYWQTLRISGQQYALHHFDINASVDKIESLFNSLKNSPRMNPDLCSSSLCLDTKDQSGASI